MNGIRVTPFQFSLEMFGYVPPAQYQVHFQSYNEIKDFLGEDRERIYKYGMTPFPLIRDGNWTFYSDRFDCDFLILWTDEAAALAKLLIVEI